MTKPLQITSIDHMLSIIEASGCEREFFILLNGGVRSWKYISFSDQQDRHGKYKLDIYHDASSSWQTLTIDNLRKESNIAEAIDNEVFYLYDGYPDDYKLKTKQINSFSFRGSKEDIATLFNPILENRPKNGLLTPDMSAEKMQCIISSVRKDLYTADMKGAEKVKIMMEHKYPPILMEDFVPLSELEQMGYIYYEDPDVIRDHFPFVDWKVWDVPEGVEVTCEMWDYEHYDMTKFIEYLHARHPRVQIVSTILPTPEEPTLKSRVIFRK